MLRLRTALGPLQERALTGILTFFLKNEDSTTTLTVEYRVGGSSSSGLDQLAPSVDEVLGEQVARLRRYIATGNPEPPAEEKAAVAADAAKAKEAAADADIAERVNALKREIESGNAAPPPKKVDVTVPPKSAKHPPETPPRP
jgi:cell pole-organizing protein PopZ